jgi:hypothetical protein
MTQCSRQARFRSGQSKQVHQLPCGGDAPMVQWRHQAQDARRQSMLNFHQGQTKSSIRLITGTHKNICDAPLAHSFLQRGIETRLKDSITATQPPRRISHDVGGLEKRIPARVAVKNLSSIGEDDRGKVPEISIVLVVNFPSLLLMVKARRTVTTSSI